jgi:hypothetical protein
MEMVGRNLKASKIAIVSSSNFSSQSRNYASRKNIKLLYRDNLIILAKKFPKKGGFNNQKNQINQINQINQTNQTNPVNLANEPNNDNLANGESHDGYISSGSENYGGIGSNSHRTAPNDLGSLNSGGAYVDHSTHISGKSSVGLGKYEPKSNSRLQKQRNSNLANKKPKNQGPPFSERIKPILSNTIVLIALVVFVSYFISYLFGIATGVSKGISGLVKILSSLILSYGFVVGLYKDGTAVLVKGTTIFFVSLVILILLIILL